MRDSARQSEASGGSDNNSALSAPVPREVLSISPNGVPVSLCV